MSSATIDRRSSSIVMENDSAIIGSAAAGTTTTTNTFHRRNSIQPRCSSNTSTAAVNSRNTDRNNSDRVKNRKNPHHHQLMRHESIDGNHSDISVNSSILGNRRRSSYYRNPCHPAQLPLRQQSPPQHRYRAKNLNDIVVNGSISSKSTKSTASSGSCNGISCSDDCGSSTTSGEPNLPYPGFPEIALKYLTQDARPRNWCLLLITNPYPFFKLAI